jgi:hypothetical protein
MHLCCSTGAPVPAFVSTKSSENVAGPPPSSVRTAGLTSGDAYSSFISGTRVTVKSVFTQGAEAGSAGIFGDRGGNVTHPPAAWCAVAAPAACAGAVVFGAAVCAANGKAAASNSREKEQTEFFIIAT